MNLKELVESEFEGFSKDDLFDFCVSIGLKPHMNTGEAKLKELLREESAKVEARSNKKLDQNLIRGLKGFPWTGLQVLINLRRDSDVKKGKKQTVAWNGNIISVPYDRDNVSIPWPHYDILANAQTGKVMIKSNPETSPELTTQYSTKFNVQYMGDDPNSKSKYKSLLEYFCDNIDIIEPMTTRQKIEILGHLTDGMVTRSYVDIKKWTDDDVQEELYKLLGIETE